jgi:hypothetical protein
LTPEQRHLYVQVSGELINKAMQPFVNSKTWENIPKIAKQQVFRQVFARMHKVAMFSVLPPDQRMDIVFDAAELMKDEAEL